MAVGDLLINGQGLPLPQRAKVDHGYTPATGDTTNLEIATSEVTPVEQRVHIGNVGKSLAKVEVQLTRPADTNAYADGDVVSDSTSSPNMITFANVAAENAATGFIRRFRMSSANASAVTETFTIHFYTSDLGGQNDNVAFVFDETNLEDYIGSIDITLADLGGKAVFQSLPNLPFICAAGDDNLYAILEITGAYTPTSAEVFTFEVLVERN